MARHENCSPEQRSGKRLSFKVSQVEVLIQNESGVVLEQGVAALDDENAGKWLYRSTADLSPGQTVVIEATALGRAGNRAVKTLHHTPQAASKSNHTRLELVL